MVIKATVRGGRIIVDEPTDLPDGTVVHLVPDNADDEMTQEEIDVLNASIAKSMEEARAGMLIPAEHVIQQIRARHKSS